MKTKWQKSSIINYIKENQIYESECKFAIHNPILNNYNTYKSIFVFEYENLFKKLYACHVLRKHDRSKNSSYLIQ